MENFLPRLLKWLGFAAAALVVVVIGFAAFWIFTLTRDLPSVEALQNYAPPITTRVYAGNGTVLGEYARERRIFVPAAFIPKLVKEAFTSAEDRNFYNHPGIDPSGIAARRHQGCRPGAAGPPAARRLHHHPAGGARLPAQLRRQVRAQGPRGDPGRPHRRHLSEGKDAGAVSQRDLSGPEQLWRGRGGAELFRQVAGRARRRRSRLPGRRCPRRPAITIRAFITKPRWTAATG